MEAAGPEQGVKLMQWDPAKLALIAGKPAEPCLRPDQLSLTSRLHGGPQPSVTNFRCLEIGCGVGLRLLPLAYYNPSAEFVGVEPTQQAAETTAASAQELGLQNLRVEQTVPNESFNYILFNERVPPPQASVLAAMVASCGERLAADGLLCMAHDVGPGCHVGSIIGRALQNATGPTANAQTQHDTLATRAESLRGVIGPNQQSPWLDLLHIELEHLTEAPSTVCTQVQQGSEQEVYAFSSVANMAATEGLSYLGDACFNQPQHSNLAHTRAALEKQEHSPNEVESLLDILAYQRTRHSLFCRLEGRAEPDIAAEEFRSWSIASPLVPSQGPMSWDPGVEVTFGSSVHGTVGVASPWAKAVLLQLASHFPRGIAVQETMAAAEAQLARNVDLSKYTMDNAQMLNELLAMHRQGLVELRYQEPAVVQPKPHAIPIHALTKLEAQRFPWLTTPYHSPMPTDRFVRLVVQQLNKEWQRKEVLDSLVRRAVQGDPSIEIDGSIVTDTEVLKPVVDELLGRALVQLERWGLLSHVRER